MSWMCEEEPQVINSQVLLVSDDPETGRIWAYALEQRGLNAIVVKSPEDALDQWAKGGFDLVVVDVYSPRLDGIDLCRRLRLGATIPVLLLTPRGDESYLLQAYEAGVDESL
jgi:two-component system OmpR family response regulator